MKPPPFHYLSAESKREAVGLLAEHGSDARILAGGQSLMPLMNRRLVRPRVLIDVSRVEEIKRISVGESTCVGAGVTQRTAERSAEIARELPLLPQALAFVGSVATRNRGTVGGSAAFADPAAEIPAALTALDTVLVLESERGARTVTAGDFFVNSFQTAIEPDELLTELRFPRLPEGARSSFLEVSRRRGGSRALAGVASVIELDVEGVCKSARFALSGVAGVPVRAAEAERQCVGGSLREALERGVAAAAVTALDPPSDAAASGGTRRKIAAALLERALITRSEVAQ